MPHFFFLFGCLSEVFLVSLFTQSAIMNKYHRLGGLNNRNLFLTVLGEAQDQDASLWERQRAAVSSSSYNGTNLLDQGSALMTSFKFVVVQLFSRVRLFLRPYELQLTRLLCPWDSPDKNTGVDCHFRLQGIFPVQGLNPSLLRLLHCQQSLYC